MKAVYKMMLAAGTVVAAAIIYSKYNGKKVVHMNTGERRHKKRHLNEVFTKMKDINE